MGAFLQGLASGVKPPGGGGDLQAMLMKALLAKQTGAGAGHDAMAAPSGMTAPSGDTFGPAAPSWYQPGMSLPGGAQGPKIPPGGVSLENRMMSEARQTTGENAPGMFQPGGFFGGGLIGALNNPDPNAPGVFDQGGFFGNGLIAKTWGKPESPERLRDRMMGRPRGGY